MSGGAIDYPNPYTLLTLGDSIKEVYEEYKDIEEEKIKFLQDLLEVIFEFVNALDYYWSGDIDKEDIDEAWKRFRDKLDDIIE